MHPAPEPQIAIRFKCHLTPEYREILAILMQEQRYRSATETFEASLAHWAQVPARHWLTSPHAATKGFRREERGRRLLALLRSGRSAEGNWLLRRVHEAIHQLEPAAVKPQASELVGGPPISAEFPALYPSINVNLIEPYAKILELMSVREGYRSATEAFESYLGMWATMPLKHQASAEWAAARGALRYQRGQELLRKLERGEKSKGSWLKFQIYDAIKHALGPDAKSPTISDVIGLLPSVVDAALEKEFA